MRQQRELQRGSMELNINKNATSSTVTTKLNNCDYFSIPSTITNANNHTPHSSPVPSSADKMENGGPCNCHPCNETLISNSTKNCSPHSLPFPPLQELGTPRKSDPDSGWFSQPEHQSPVSEHVMANGNCNPIVRDRRISAINLSRLQRNMVEIYSIMQESGIQFSFDNENNN